MSKDLEHILYIDDEPDILEIATMCLENVGGFRVTPSNSGPGGIDLALKNHPDFILIDVMMPGLDGPGTLKQIRQHPELSHIPIAFMTARVQPHEVEQYKAMGASGVIAKPFDPMALSDEIQTIWDSLNA